MPETRPVMIVGAGPTGMSAALDLARMRVPVRIVDKYTTPPDTSRALAVQARTLEMMQQRGLAAEMVRRGNPGRSVALYDGPTVMGRVDLFSIESRFNYILLLAQSETEAILRDALARAGVLIETGTELIAFAQPDNANGGVQATLRRQDGSIEEVDAAYLIDAEGAHSTVRRSMDLAFQGEALPHTYALADLYADGDLPQDQLSIFPAQQGLIAAFPMGNGRLRVIATEKSDVASGTSKDTPPPTVSEIQQMWDSGTHISMHFRDMVWSSRFRINSRALTQLRHRSVFFGGDSAHIHSPAGGQGMNTGIQDMFNLAWKLALVYRGVAKAELLDTYNDERMPVIHRLVSTTERATDLFNADSGIVHTLIDHALPLLLHFDRVREGGATMVSQLGVGYGASPLNGDPHRAGSLRVGERFPDIPLHAGGARALDLLDATAFTVVRCGPGAYALPDTPSVSLAYRNVEQPSPELIEALGQRQVAVIRPDGYVLMAGPERHISIGWQQWATHWLALARPSASH